jgi:hypothetical protein
MDRAVATLGELEADRGLLNENAYAPRAAALRELEFVHDVLSVAGRPGRHALRRVRALRTALDAVDARLYARLRAEVIAGRLRGVCLRALLDAHTAYRPAGPPNLHLELEPADGLVDGILGLDTFRGEPSLADRDYVHLEDTPVRVLLDLLDHVALGPGDVFVDLGSGLGRAVALVHLLSNVPCEGIEVQPEYWAYSRGVAAVLGLAEVTFQKADAREADLSRGTVFYLFTPFKGRILRDVLDRLRAEARSRPITVCTYGSVSLVVAGETWLTRVTGEPPHEFSLVAWRSV